MKPCVFLSALILFTFILFPTMCPALTAADEIKFQNLTIEDGLFQSSVFEIQQDKRGLMWFGTYDGLNRFDGYQFTIYKYNEKIHTVSATMKFGPFMKTEKENFGSAPWKDSIGLFALEQLLNGNFNQLSFW